MIRIVKRSECKFHTLKMCGFCCQIYLVGIATFPISCILIFEHFINLIGWILILCLCFWCCKIFLHIYKTSIQAGFQDSSLLHIVAYVLQICRLPVLLYLTVLSFNCCYSGGRGESLLHFLYQKSISMLCIFYCPPSDLWWLYLSSSFNSNVKHFYKIKISNCTKPRHCTGNY